LKFKKILDVKLNENQLDLLVENYKTRKHEFYFYKINLSDNKIALNKKLVSLETDLYFRTSKFINSSANSQQHLSSDKTIVLLTNSAVLAKESKGFAAIYVIEGSKVDTIEVNIGLDFYNQVANGFYKLKKSELKNLDFVYSYDLIEQTAEGFRFLLKQKVQLPKTEGGVSSNNPSFPVGSVSSISSSNKVYGEMKYNYLNSAIVTIKDNVASIEWLNELRNNNYEDNITTQFELKSNVSIASNIDGLNVLSIYNDEIVSFKLASNANTILNLEKSSITNKKDEIFAQKFCNLSKWYDNYYLLSGYFKMSSFGKEFFLVRKIKIN